MTLAQRIRPTLAVARKDLRNLFLSPLFYGVACLCTITWTLIYFMGLQEFSRASFMSAAQGGMNEANLHNVVFARHISIVNLVLIFSISAMSVRFFTEEKRNQSLNLLLTAPISATGITIGKFVAGLLGAWALVVVSALYPLSLAPFAQIEWGPLATSYLGLFLISGCYVAVGLFASVLTESNVLAILMALIFNVLLWFLGALTEVSEHPVVTKVFEHLNVGSHFVSLIGGQITVAGLAFFLSVIFLMTFLTQRVVESYRWR